jgi:GTPase
MTRFGSVALVGRTNVGKSTFLNAALGDELAVVSPVPQTTREALLGVVHRPDAQMAFVDTPGLHRPKSELGRRMNAAALEVARAADVVVLITDVDAKVVANPETALARDHDVLELVPRQTPTVLVVNKVDLVRDKARLLPVLEAYQRAREFSALVPVSLRSRGGAEKLLEIVAELLPEGEPGYESDTLTDRRTPYFVREYVREQVLAFAKGEVPHAVAVSVDAIEQRGKVLAIKATIHVEKDGQRRILVGKGGIGVKTIGTGARARLERLLGQQIFLELFVRVTPKWKHVPRQLTELGYEAPEDRALTRALPDAPRRRGARRRT